MSQILCIHCKRIRKQPSARGEQFTELYLYCLRYLEKQERICNQSRKIVTRNVFKAICGIQEILLISLFL